MRDNHPKEGEDKWPCDDCDKVFTSKRYLNKHVANCHKGKLICPYCSKLCTKSHIITAHKEQPSVCDICSAVFKNKHALSGHKRKVHAEKVMVTCPDCFQVLSLKLCGIFIMNHCRRCLIQITNFTITGTRCTTCKTVVVSFVEGLTRTKSCCRSTRESHIRISMRPPRTPRMSGRSSSTQPTCNLPRRSWLPLSRLKTSVNLVLIPSPCSLCPNPCHCFPSTDDAYQNKLCFAPNANC